MLLLSFAPFQSRRLAAGLLFASLALATVTRADPLLTSWMTVSSGRYARLYETTSARASGTTSTTWSGQTQPAYSDIEAVQYSANWVYVQYSGLASYTMGPWLNPQGGQFQYWPTNRQGLRRFPRSPVAQSGTKDSTSAGYSGLFVNGVAIFNALDGQAWNGTGIATQAPHTQSTYYWHRNAPVAEAFNFDDALGHQPPTAIYHTHQNPLGLRYELGDHVDFNSSTKAYSESGTTPTQHSPIIGWAHDGYPIYGPYGYSSPLDPGSGVRRMVAGYVKRDGTHGTDTLSANLSTIPAWYARYRQAHFGGAYSTTAGVSRAAVNSTYPLGTFAQDWAYLGDLTNPDDNQPYAQGADFDLDEYNGRYCVTPEYPNGTYAYFTAIDSAGAATYPYLLAFEFYGDATGGSVTGITETVSTQATGGADTPLALATPAVDPVNDTVTLSWDSVEGGTYLVETSTDQSHWSTAQAGVASGGLSTSATVAASAGTGYVRVTRSAIATYASSTTTTLASVQTATASYQAGGPSVTTPIANVALTTTAGASTVVDLDTVFSGTGLSYAVAVDGDAVTATIGGDGTLSLTPTGVAGTVTVTVTATDANTDQISTSFSVTVTASHDPAYGLTQNLASWRTKDSARYARIYETYADEQAGHAVTTWDNGTYAQTTPAYAGVQAIAYTADAVYLTTTGLAAGHVMGPWYNDTGPGGSLEVFRNWPEAIRTYFKIPAQPVIPASHTTLPAGAIGLMVDGTLIFSSSDTFSWDGSKNADTGPTVTGGGNGTGVWNHNAYITEGNTFDRSNSHCAGNQLHYHAEPMKLRWLLGDSVDAVSQADGSVAYVEDFNGRHSPILGWMADGLPLYGPYGYADPDPASTDTTIRRMRSGFALRDGTGGTYDIPAHGRDRLPDWAARFQGIGPAVSGTQAGPANASVAEPYFMEDYDYLGDVTNPATGQPYAQGTDFDLNEYNVRWCRTPEFPDGTWAYFTCIDADGHATFPYNVAVQYYGDPTGGAVNTVDAAATAYFAGGPATPESNRALAADNGADTVTVSWNVVEGAGYTVQTSSDLAAWDDSMTGVTADDDVLEIHDTGALAARTKQFYRITRTGLAAYDDGSANSASGGNPSGGGGTGTGGSATFAAQFPTTPPLPPQNVATVTVGGVATTITSYNQTSGAVTVQFDDGTLAAGTAYKATLSFTPPGGSTQTITSTNSYTKP